MYDIARAGTQRTPAVSVSGGREFYTAVGGDPAHEELIAQRQECGADEHSKNTCGRHSAERPDQDDRHWRVDAATEHKRLENVVCQSGDEDQQRVEDRLTLP